METLEIAGKKFNSRLISDFQNAKTLKLIVPVAMDKGISLMELGFAIKENGIKINLILIQEMKTIDLVGGFFLFS